MNSLLEIVKMTILHEMNLLKSLNNFININEINFFPFHIINY